MLIYPAGGSRRHACPGPPALLCRPSSLLSVFPDGVSAGRVGRLGVRGPEGGLWQSRVGGIQEVWVPQCSLQGEPGRLV